MLRAYVFVCWFPRHETGGVGLEPLSGESQYRVRIRGNWHLGHAAIEGRMRQEAV